MSEYNHVDKKEYLIVEGQWWRVWNNGIVESYSTLHKTWDQRNSDHTWQQRLQFIKIWEEAGINEGYNFSWGNSPSIGRSNSWNSPKFLGFKEECPECKQSYMVWEGKIQLCKGCDYIHAFQYDDS